MDIRQLSYLKIIIALLILILFAASTNAETIENIEETIAIELEKELNDIVESTQFSDEADYEEFYIKLKNHSEQQLSYINQKIEVLSPKLGLYQKVNKHPDFQLIVEEFVTLKRLIHLREQLFKNAPASFVNKYSNLKLQGVNEAKFEFSYLKFQFKLLLSASYQRVAEMPRRLQQAPVDVFLTLIGIVVGIVVFRIWRKWAKHGLVEWRQKILSIRPRTAGKMKAARFIWYFDQTRGAIEWLILLTFVISQLSFLELNVLQQLLTTIVFWLFFTVFVFSLLNTYIERSKQGLIKTATYAQNLSIKLLIWLLGLYLLSSQLLSVFIGAGTLLYWLKTAFVWLVLPFYVFFVYQWRNEARQYILNERDIGTRVKSLTKHRAGLKGFVVANIIFAFILYYLFTKLLLRLISRVESGRRLTAELYRKKLFNSNEQVESELKDSQPISEQQRETLINSDKHINERVFDIALEKINNRIERNEKSHLAIVGERGIGKTTLLNFLDKKYENTLILNCTETFETLPRALNKALNIENNASTEETIEALNNDNIAMVMLDNCHRLACPKAGGQRQLKQLYGWINELRKQVFWVMAFESNAWQLINAFSITGGFYSKVIRLRGWQEEDIVQLLEQRSKLAGIDVEFSHLNIPRQIADIEEDTLELRNKSGIYRIIWGYAEGNPAISSRVWADAIVQQNNKYLACLPNYPETKKLEEFEINTLLVLRVICQFGRVNTKDLVDNLRLHGLVINSATASLLAQGIIEQVENRYQISWRWFRAVTRFLARQNLLTE